MKNKGFLVIGLIVSLAAVLVAAAGEGSVAWRQFGGPRQDFRAPAEGLKLDWPEAGPPRLWSRELGDGYSAILYDAGRLYTMYRNDESEVVIALDAGSGKTVWEFAYEASPREGHVDRFGRGPRATPLIAGDHIYTIGVSGVLHCLKKNDGSVVWKHDLWEDFGGNVLIHGYSSSPIEYKGKLIALVGGENQSIVAFDRKTGEVAWKNLSFKNSYSTPQVLKVNGKDQLVTFMATELIGVDPSNGELQWQVAHENQWQQNVNMPVLVDGQYLFMSAPQAGARGLKLSADGDGTRVEEIWSTRKIQFYHVTSVLEGDWVYGSTGTMGPAFMAAVNVRTGKIGWRERGFAKANVIGADGKLFLLDEEGNLAVTTATPDGLQVHDQFQVFEDTAWTVPTIVGKTMYLRDKAKILALDLS